MTADAPVPETHMSPTTPVRGNDLNSHTHLGGLGPLLDPHWAETGIQPFPLGSNGVTPILK